MDKIPKKVINYKTALSIFLRSPTSFKYNLDPYDIVYLYCIANYQDINESLQICYETRTKIAKFCRMSERQIIRIGKRLKSLNLIKSYKLKKRSLKVLSEDICSIPEPFIRIIMLPFLKHRCLLVTYMGDCQSPTWVTNSHPTYKEENIDKEIDKDNKPVDNFFNQKQKAKSEEQKRIGKDAITQIINKLRMKP